MKQSLLFAIVLLSITSSSLAQDDDLSALVNKNTQTPAKENVSATFKGLRIINAQTNETCKKHNMIFNIQHRFGDVFTNGNVNVHTFFGLDVASDIRFAFDYGITDRLQVGVGRSRGLPP